MQAQTPCFKQINNIILVASGKGGVGKSTTAVNLALALSQSGSKVGLLDADVYGPSLPLMMGMQGQRPTSLDGKIMEPLVGFGIKVNSIGFLINPEDAAVWRGPMASSALSQLIGETNWGELDYLIVDMPPGTGDIQLTISQKFPCTGAVIVTTPQNIALADAEKGVAMFTKVNIPVLGIVENMSYFQCSKCGNVEHIFGKDGAVAMAKEHGTELLGQIPLQQQTRENSDNGTPTVTTDSPMADIYRDIAKKLIEQLVLTQQKNAAASGPEISFIDD
ncbi:MAG: iron-sulfur cluster carrier protein ApbC [Algicola sp.]|nr:iron-sulfur cluster carrier protein ApbC [Algicola sp.]